MPKCWMNCFVAALLTAACLSAQAGGVFIVSRKGVNAYRTAQNGFLQMAYTIPLQDLNPKALELDGTEADQGNLDKLKKAAPDLVFSVGAHATKEVRKVLPDVWIVYAMVYYPEAEGLKDDPKMVGIESKGSARELRRIAGTFDRIRSVAIIHSTAIQPSIPRICADMESAGLGSTVYPVSDPSELAGVMDSLKGKEEAILLLPDPITGNADALRFILTKCMEWKVLPFSYSDSLVASGALCGTFFSPDVIGNHGAKVADRILKGNPPPSKVSAPEDPSVSCNNGTAKGLDVEFSRKIKPEITYE